MSERDNIDKLADELLKARAARTCEPPPFFHTRVLAAVREQESQPSPFVRLWRAAGALVAAMAVLVAILVVLTFTTDRRATGESMADNNTAIDSLFTGETGDEINDNQVIRVVIEEGYAEER